MATTGHEGEVITVEGAKAALQKFKTDHVDTLLGPTYNAVGRKVIFPVTAKVRYDSSTRRVVFL